MSNAKQNTLELNNASPMEVAALNKATALLKGIKANYIIVLGGMQFVQGDLKLEETKKRTRKFTGEYPYGTFTNYIRAAGLEKLQVSEVISIDCGGYPTETIRSVACSMGNKKWGNNAVFSTINGNVVEIMRIA